VLSRTPLDLLHVDADKFESLVQRRPALKEAFLSRTAKAAEATADA
jgi:hypothetical protein